jgi:hypothetical protein
LFFLFLALKKKMSAYSGWPFTDEDHTDNEPKRFLQTIHFTPSENYDGGSKPAASGVGIGGICIFRDRYTDWSTFYDHRFDFAGRPKSTAGMTVSGANKMFRHWSHKDEEGVTPYFPVTQDGKKFVPDTGFTNQLKNSVTKKVIKKILN